MIHSDVRNALDFRDYTDEEIEAVQRFLFNHEKCGVSTGIDGSPTIGYGKLDDNGFWEFPLRPSILKLHNFALWTLLFSGKIK